MVSLRVCWNHSKMNILLLERKPYEDREFVLLITLPSAPKECPAHRSSVRMDGWTDGHGRTDGRTDGHDG